MGKKKKKKTQPQPGLFLDTAEQDSIIDGFLTSLQHMQHAPCATLDSPAKSSIDNVASDELVVASDVVEGDVTRMQHAPCAKDSPLTSLDNSASDEQEHMQHAPCATVDSPAKSSLDNAASDEHVVASDVVEERMQHAPCAYKDSPAKTSLVSAASDEQVASDVVEGDATHMQHAPCAHKDSPTKTSRDNAASDEHVFDVFADQPVDGSSLGVLPSSAVIYDLATDDKLEQVDHGSGSQATVKQYQDDVHTQLVAHSGMPRRPAWSDVVDDDDPSDSGPGIGVATVSGMPSTGHAGSSDSGTQCEPLQFAAPVLPVLPFTPPDEGEAGSECRSVARLLGHDNSEGARGLDGAPKASADALDERVQCALDDSDTLGYGDSLGPQSDIHVGSDVVGNGAPHVQHAPRAIVDNVDSPAKTSLDIAASDEHDVANGVVEGDATRKQHAPCAPKDSPAKSSLDIAASDEHDVDPYEELPDGNGINEFLVGKSAEYTDFHRIAKSILPDVYGDDLDLVGYPCDSAYVGLPGFDTRSDGDDLDLVGFPCDFADAGPPGFGIRSDELSHMQHAPCAKDLPTRSTPDNLASDEHDTHMQQAPCAKDSSALVGRRTAKNMHPPVPTDGPGRRTSEPPKICTPLSPPMVLESRGHHMTSPDNVASDEHEHVQHAPCATGDSPAKTSFDKVASDEHVVDSRMQHAPCAIVDTQARSSLDNAASEEHDFVEGDATQQHASCAQQRLSALESLANFERFGHRLDPSPLKDLLLAFFPKQRALLEMSAALGTAAARNGTQGQEEGND